MRDTGQKAFVLRFPTSTFARLGPRDKICSDSVEKISETVRIIEQINMNCFDLDRSRRQLCSCHNGFLHSHVRVAIAVQPLLMNIVPIVITSVGKHVKIPPVVTSSTRHFAVLQPTDRPEFLADLD